MNPYRTPAQDTDTNETSIKTITKDVGKIVMTIHLNDGEMFLIALCGYVLNTSGQNTRFKCAFNWRIRDGVVEHGSDVKLETWFVDASERVTSFLRNAASQGFIEAGEEVIPWHSILKIEKSRESFEATIHAKDCGEIY